MQFGDTFSKKTKNNKQSDGIVISPGSAALKFLRLSGVDLLVSKSLANDLNYGRVELL